MKKLYIFGVGLIGGSIALKASELNIFDQIIGIGRPGGSSLENLVEAGVLTSSSPGIDKNINEASLIIIAAPVEQTKVILKKIEPFITENTIITDVGSTKFSVMNEAKFLLKDKFSQFIGSHPIAGSEKHGTSAAKNNLFLHDIFFSGVHGGSIIFVASKQDHGQTLKLKAQIKLEESLLDRLNEIVKALTKQFAEKNDTRKALKLLEKNLKNMYDLFMSKNGENGKEDDAMFTKKPLGGTSCASCAKDVVDLYGKRVDYQPWGKLPFRDPSERIARVG